MHARAPAQGNGRRPAALRRRTARRVIPVLVAVALLLLGVRAGQRRWQARQVIACLVKTRERFMIQGGRSVMGLGTDIAVLVAVTAAFIAVAAHLYPELVR